ncbi:hypothetical protein SUGI_0204850 [Cryptomeria japonica]|uniref:lipase-like PAD4 n=1 Tax=Cryptomeria japonica TaxID=3369 RepID=UPI0024089468|nr:lipase-like PAD4 [Cryptomeria japonica]GLJ13082.1 hypothetical protein SUGI_0204850 [Cryptomeria japonica]
MEASKICRAEENITYFVGTDLISEAWNACQNAYKSRDFYKIEYKNVLIIAFSGAPNSRDYVTDNDFDECDINYNLNDEFNCLVDGDSENPKPAMVRKAFLDRFLCTLRSSNLKAKILEVQKDIVEKKTIIFTGHSFGGAIASLWTLWTLEKRHKIPPLCITFGCPLVGDKIFAKAIEREKWSHYFCHIVSRNDIVPRICFSPFKSPFISKALDELLPYWYDSMRNRKAENQTKVENQSKVENQKTVQDGSHPLSKENSQEFIKQVISDASQVLTHETTALVVGPANLVGGAAKDLIKRSPYRPFGYYVFCSTSGSVCCIENTETALHMLYFALENSKLFGACIMEHIEYDKTIKHISKSSGLTASYSKTVKSDKSSADDVRIDLQLEAMGIGNQNTQAWLGLKTIEENKNKLAINIDQQIVKLDEMQEFMAELEWYKTMCEGNQSNQDKDLNANKQSYYECFKTNKTENDMKANKNRVKLAAFWDRITELVEKEELPKDLQTQDKWINAGTEYRLLVEPLDIAHYYRLGKHEDSGSYIARGRPRRYKLLQKWLDDKKKKSGTESVTRSKPPILTQNSCFWAYVEEAINSSTDKEPKDYKMQLENMVARHEISSEDLSSSTITNWQNSLSSKAG